MLTQLWFHLVFSCYLSLLNQKLLWKLKFHELICSFLYGEVASVIVEVGFCGKSVSWFLSTGAISPCALGAKAPEMGVSNPVFTALHLHAWGVSPVVQSAQLRCTPQDPVKAGLQPQLPDPRAYLHELWAGESGGLVACFVGTSSVSVALGYVGTRPEG